MRQHQGPKLFRFVLFNDSWGLQEGTESEKVIYYDIWDQQPRSSTDFGVSTSDSNLLNQINPSSPSTVTFDPSDQTFGQVLKDVGFAEAMIKFVTNFGEDEQLSSVHGCRVRLVMEQIEPHFWICCTLLVPKTITAALNDNQPEENHQHLIEYHEDELNDHYVRLLISQIHETFCLFNGSLQDLWRSCDHRLNLLRSQCSRFFQWFLATIQLFSINLLHLWGGMSYLPIDNLVFLEAQCFVQQTLAVHSQCRNAFFLYNDQLVFSSLSLKATAQLYRYLISILLPEVTSEEMSETFRSRDSARTRFVRAIQMVHLPHEEPALNLLSDKSGRDREAKKHCSKYDRQLMAVYRSNNGGTVVLLLEPDTGDDSSWVCSDQTIKSNKDYSKDETLQHVLERLHTYMASRLPDLVSKMAENSIRLMVSLDSNLNCGPNSSTSSLLGGSAAQESSNDQL